MMNEQDKFVVNCMKQMTNVLNNCNKQKGDCICTIQVSHVDDSSLSEKQKYRTSIYCGEKGDPFHYQMKKTLDQANKSIDPMT